MGNENENDGWGGARIMMADPTKMIDRLKT